MFKRKKTIKKLKEYLDNWDTERHGYVNILPDGRLIPTNNIDLGEFCLVKGDLKKLCEYIEKNT